jgi:hypothetical protein
VLAVNKYGGDAGRGPRRPGGELLGVQDEDEDEDVFIVFILAKRYEDWGWAGSGDGLGHAGGLLLGCSACGGWAAALLHGQVRLLSLLFFLFLFFFFCCFF